jgi:hypothetical protein
MTRPPAARGLSKRPPVRPSQFEVVLFGDRYLRWAPNLANDPIWPRLARVSSVTQQGEQWRRNLLQDSVDRQRFVLPLHESDILRIPCGSWALLPSLDALRNFADKQRFSEFVARARLQAFAPETYALGSEVFPLILKRTNLTATDG